MNPSIKPNDLEILEQFTATDNAASADELTHKLRSHQASCDNLQIINYKKNGIIIENTPTNKNTSNS